MSEADTAQWVERCRAGDEAAVEWLVRAYQPAIFRLALSILDDAAEADEAAQDAFVAALKGLEAYRGDAAFSTWLYAITLNVCRGRLRRRQAWLRLRQTLRAALTWQGQPAADPEAVTLQQESDAAIWTAVDALGERHRLPVILRYHHGFPVAEIARILGLAEGTVHSRLNTARERLRITLQRVALQEDTELAWDQEADAEAR